MPDPADRKATTPPDPGLIPADADVRQGNSRKDPAVTDRDRELAHAFTYKWIVRQEEVRKPFPVDRANQELAELRAQARREGREEGLREALESLAESWGRLRTHYRGDDPVPFWMKRAEERVAALLNQPAPEGVEE